MALVVFTMIPVDVPVMTEWGDGFFAMMAKKNLESESLHRLCMMRYNAGYTVSGGSCRGMESEPHSGQG
jgi:hypothetical protein